MYSGLVLVESPYVLRFHQITIPAAHFLIWKGDQKPKSQILTSEGERVDLGDGFASRAVMARWVAVSRWFKRQRSGSRRLIFVKSSWVRPSGWGCLVGFGAVIGSEAKRRWKNESGVVVNFEARDMICNGF
ncbi:hypothetical protein ACFX13_001416 [Malus domestica]